MSTRSQPVADWHGGRLSSEELAAVLGDELLGDLDGFTAAQRRRSQARFGPAWYVGDWWESLREELDLTGFSADDHAALLAHLSPRLPEWALRPPPPPQTEEEPSATRDCVARLYLDVDGAFSPICMGSQHTSDLAWMRGPAVAIGEAPDTGWTWKMTGGWGPTPIPIELAHYLADLNVTAVEVVWLTSWHEMANGLLDDVDVSACFRCHPQSEDLTVNEKWQHIVSELQRDPVPFVWIDDQQVNPSTWRWADTCGVPNLLVHTNRYHGVTPATWSTVIAWLQEHSGVDLSHLGGVTRLSSTGAAGRDE